MIIGFLGKGGSGKSTLATIYAKHIASKGDEVLAIDADHNMDLSYNLNAPEDFPFFGTTGTKFLLDNFGTGNKKYEINVYSDIFKQEELPSFTFGKKEDLFTKTYSKKVADNISLMSSGPHNDIILHGNRCSHSLGTPLKVYLPLLNINENQHVVVDMIASSDAAATGIPTGFSYAYIAVEPTPHSIKAASQIMDTLKFFGVPHGIVLNKSSDTERDTQMIRNTLACDPVAIFHNTISPLDHSAQSDQLEALVTNARKHTEIHGDNRKSRSIEKIYRNHEFKVANLARL